MGPFIGEKAVAERLSVSLPAVRRWRYESRGPRFVKFGSAVRYAISDLEAWISSRPTGGGK